MLSLSTLESMVHSILIPTWGGSQLPHKPVIRTPIPDVSVEKTTFTSRAETSGSAPVFCSLGEGYESFLILYTRKKKRYVHVNLRTGHQYKLRDINARAYVRSYFRIRGEAKEFTKLIDAWRNCLFMKDWDNLQREFPSLQGISPNTDCGPPQCPEFDILRGMLGQVDLLDSLGTRKKKEYAQLWNDALRFEYDPE